MNSIQNKKKVIVISSVSGGGKTTLIRLLLKKYSSMTQGITATTRKPRGIEKHEVDYLFLSADEFETYIRKGSFLEYAKVHGNYYGVPLQSVTDKLLSGFHVILNVDVQGMQKIKEVLGKENIVSIFLMPPSKEAWEQRLRNRNTDTEKEILFRLEQGAWEMEHAKLFDYVIVNDRIEDTLEKIKDIFEENHIH